VVLAVRVPDPLKLVSRDFEVAPVVVHVISGSHAEGSRLLGLEPNECLFIDDDPQLVNAAQELGYHGITIDRDAQRTVTGVIVSLDDLLPIVEARRTAGANG
jgi:methionine salvage enolase-phosphatase E1